MNKANNKRKKSKIQNHSRNQKAKNQKVNILMIKNPIEHKAATKR